MPPQKFQTTERANEDAEEKTAATTACVHAKPDEQGDFDHQYLQAQRNRGSKDHKSPPAQPCGEACFNDGNKALWRL